MHSYYFPGNFAPSLTHSCDSLHECVSFWSKKKTCFNYVQQMEKEASHENILIKTRAVVTAAESEAQPHNQNRCFNRTTFASAIKRWKPRHKEQTDNTHPLAFLGRN